MGVDYTGLYGVGIKIQLPTFDEEHEFYEDEESWLDQILGEEYSYFDVGAGSYTGESNEFYVCLKNPFKDGYNILDKVVKLKKFLSDNEIKFFGEVDEVGGLLID
jgi:hypothetical protein